jgi:small GTP-binding protein
MRNFIFKIVVGGNGGVGKTTLLRRYVDGVFDESTIETVGVEFFVKEIKLENVGTSCSLQIWDLGGQQRFRHLLQNFTMGARGALLLFDLTQMPVIEEVLNWVNLLRSHDINLPIILIGTKLDLVDLIAVNDESAFDIKQIFNMADYIKTSSKTGKNVNLVFQTLANILISKSRN